jgi:hypothetical protein
MDESGKVKNGQKKTLPTLLDRDKTKNKHYEQTLIFSRTYIKRVKKVPRLGRGLHKKQKL